MMFCGLILFLPSALERRSAPKAKRDMPISIASFMAAVEVFMDTAGFLALWDAGDGHHAAAVRLQQELVRKRRHFLTTEYVADETITLLLARHSHRAATDFLDTIERSEALRLEWIDLLVSTPPLTGFASMATNNGPSPTASVSLSCTSSGFA